MSNNDCRILIDSWRRQAAHLRNVADQNYEIWGQTIPNENTGMAFAFDTAADELERTLDRQSSVEGESE